MSNEIYLEFNDPKDPESNSYADANKSSFKLSVEPQMYLVAMIQEPKMLAADVLTAVRQLMYEAYRQGKRVGALSDETKRLKTIETAVRDLEPYFDQLVCYGSTTSEHKPNELVKNMREALGNE